MLNQNSPHTITINSRDFWTDSGIDVEKGQTYKFRAEGNWFDFYICSTANGYSNCVMNLCNSKKRSPENKWFALMGAIDKGPPILIGEEALVEMPQSGRLFFFANDVDGFYWNNWGKIKLSVTRQS